MPRDLESAVRDVARVLGFPPPLRIVPQLDGIPRHLGIHNGGMVLSGPPSCDLVPLETWSVVQQGLS